MADIPRKCVVTRYDPTIKEPPYLTIPIDEFVVMEPEDTHDDLGVRFAARLKKACNMKGYCFQFYTMFKREHQNKDGDFDYEVVVYHAEERFLDQHLHIKTNYVYLSQNI